MHVRVRTFVSRPREKERCLRNQYQIPIGFIDDPMKKVTRYLVGERLN